MQSLQKKYNADFVSNSASHPTLTETVRQAATPTVSVIIPTYNRCHTLARAIDSVLHQTRPADEIIVIDDGSTDDTAALLEKYNDVICLKQSNSGVSSARNNGIARASSSWIAFLDSDDEWLPSKLHEQLSMIEQQPETRICHTDEIWIRNGRRVNPARKHTKAGGWIYSMCLPLCAISPSAVMIHHSLFEQHGTFDTDLPACEDYDLWLRLCSHWPVTYLETQLLYKYGGHTDQLSRKYDSMDRFRIRALEKILRSNTLDEKNHQATITTLLDKSGVYLKGAIKRGRYDEAEKLLDQLDDLMPTDSLRTHLSLSLKNHGEVTFQTARRP